MNDQFPWFPWICSIPFHWHVRLPELDTFITFARDLSRTVKSLVVFNSGGFLQFLGSRWNWLSYNWHNKLSTADCHARLLQYCQNPARSKSWGYVWHTNTGFVLVVPSLMPPGHLFWLRFLIYAWLFSKADILDVPCLNQTKKKSNFCKSILYFHYNKKSQIKSYVACTVGRLEMWEK